MVYEYARMLKIGSITDTFRVPPAGGAATTTAFTESIPGREVFAAPAETKNISPRISSATKIAGIFRDVRFQFIFPPTVSSPKARSVSSRVIQKSATYSGSRRNPKDNQ